MEKNIRRDTNGVFCALYMKYYDIMILKLLDIYNPPTRTPPPSPVVCVRDYVIWAFWLCESAKFTLSLREYVILNICVIAREHYFLAT